MRRSPSVWRLALLWQGTVLDVVSLSRTRTTLELRTGDRLKARVVGDGVEITGPGIEAVLLQAGVLAELPAGHTVVATKALAEARVGRLSAVDSTLFHAAMIGAAVQACVVSALVLSPASALDPEPGAGLGEYRRF